MAGNVDEANDVVARCRKIGEAEIDRHAPRLLFLEPIRVDARQRLHQRRLAVIDMSSRADDHD